MIAALALMRPSREFMVETSGWPSPVGQIVRYPTGPFCIGTRVTFNEYAAAVEGMLQLPCGIGKLRYVPPVMGGPPKVPFAFRVSTTRHGVTGTNCRAVGGGVTSNT